MWELFPAEVFFFKKGICFWSAFSLCLDWDQIELESEVDEGASIVQVTFWRAAFHGGCLQDSEASFSFKHHQHLTATSTYTLIQTFIYFPVYLILLFNKLFTRVNLTLFNRPRPSFCCCVIGQFNYECELSWNTQW